MSRFIDADALYMDVIRRYDYCDDFIEMIEQCPTADVRPNVHEEWIHDGDCYICNQCKTSYEWWADSQCSNFCPNCGADMRKGEKE